MTLRSLPKALHRAGQPVAARAEPAAALRLAAEIGNDYRRVRGVRYADEDELARHHWRQALTLCTQLGGPEADQARSQLSAQEATVQP
jgi:hypothetical protein